LGAEGRGFESLRPDQSFLEKPASQSSELAYTVSIAEGVSPPAGHIKSAKNADCIWGTRVVLTRRLVMRVHMWATRQREES
jgi:hypothetical protein